MQLGMTQGKLADELDVTFQQVQKYEKGTNRISASRLHHIAMILEVPFTSFFKGAPDAVGHGEGPTPNLETEFLATREGRALMRAFQRVPSRALRKSLIAMVEELAEFEYDHHETAHH